MANKSSLTVVQQLMEDKNYFSAPSCLMGDKICSSMVTPCLMVNRNCSSLMVPPCLTDGKRNFSSLVATFLSVKKSMVLMLREVRNVCCHSLRRILEALLLLNIHSAAVKLAGIVDMSQLTLCALTVEFFSLMKTYFFGIWQLTVSKLTLESCNRSDESDQGLLKPHQDNSNDKFHHHSVLCYL